MGKKKLDSTATTQWITCPDSVCPKCHGPVERDENLTMYCQKCDWTGQPDELVSDCDHCVDPCTQQQLIIHGRILA